MLTTVMRLPDSIQGKVDSRFRMWGVNRLSQVVDIDYSDRIRFAWGRTCVDQYRVRLNPELLNKGDAFFDEVLCHELAHIAIYARMALT